MLAQSMGNDQNIRKQDSPVETEPVDRLQSHFAGCLAIVSQFQKPALLRA